MTRARIPYVEEYYDLLAYEVDPLGVYRLCRNQRLPHITVNQYGYRGAPFTGAETILLLGDSVTFGVGSSSDEARFARFLEACTGEQVADASVRAYRVFQHFMHLPRLLEMLPRVRSVLLWCGFTDLIYWVMTGGCVQGAFHLEWKYRSRSPRDALIPSKWQRRFKVRQVSDVIARWVGGEPQAFARDTGTLEDLVAHTATYIKGVHDVCASRQLTMALLIQPFLRARPTHESLQRLLDLHDEKTLEKCGQGWYEIAPQFVQRLQQRLRDRQGLLLVDCLGFVSECNYFDQVHLNEEGIRGVAKCLAEDQSLWRRQLSEGDIALHCPA